MNIYCLLLYVSLFSLPSISNLFQDPTPCSRVTCSFYGTCRLKEGGTPYCACLDSCLEVYRPVCGSDDASYFSECFLQINSCRLRKRITVKYSGHCSKFVFFSPSILSVILAVVVVVVVVVVLRNPRSPTQHKPLWKKDFFKCHRVTSTLAQIITTTSSLALQWTPGHVEFLKVNS